MYWYRLISHWCAQLGRYGLTLPYLIGAGHKLQKNTDLKVGELLKEICESNKKIVLSYCNDLDEFILGLPKGEYGFIDNVQHFGSLYVFSDKLDDYKTLEALTLFFENTYEKNFSQNLYSKDYDTGSWADFTVEETEEIKKTAKTSNAALSEVYNSKNTEL